MGISRQQLLGTIIVLLLLFGIVWWKYLRMASFLR
jgi:hypothetical protein